jgi:hypothetical protein
MRINSSLGEQVMRKVLISAAAAVSALAFAVPAAAQYYPAQPYGHAYGYNNAGHVRSLQARVDNLQREINRLDKRNVLSKREAGSLREQSRQIERQLRYSSRNGLNPNESNSIERRLAGLEQRISYEMRDGNRYAGRGNNQWTDRDRDGRNDRWEDDRGYRHD